jgi:hypothetical protein
LDSIDHPLGRLVVAEGHQHLIQYNIVEHLMAGSLKTLCKGICVSTGTLNQVRYSLLSQSP